MISTSDLMKGTRIEVYGDPFTVVDIGNRLVIDTRESRTVRRT